MAIFRMFNCDRRIRGDFNMTFADTVGNSIIFGQYIKFNPY